ncbi:MAG: NupC/NupG family nucleoside CNT transporter [candidate division KSB1 bacterium]|nr:NupC/NupG family nucleoside CNT transporter [candidate division KSB1 bacterium]MDZ7272667.1 NupC/NupG family nucleoside CNT transporter [candidate division KSB1 bacterium]MDZ7284311.1 NupC/NupG family nucleoside CNT transporter [candidate division KSB1 bacterium]MDZ7297293.1 NupC/NupG family nucleoside CNT transporter [candidate division KSB1 bacterium]MDZ7309033.1 NupC/NupG family nucleoside CNT transporter [candidate division KSB1 bacterium]
MERLISLLGMFILLALAYAISYDRRNFPWRVVLWGTGLQLLFAVIILWTEAGKTAFQWTGDKITAFLGFTKYGTEFLFGNLVKPEFQNTFGFQFAFAILPTIIFFSAVMSILYYLGVMQRVVELIARAMAKTMGTSGAESLSCSANIFVGQTEAPLLIRPFIAQATRSELMAIMCGGFATVAGGVLAGYIAMGIPASHLLAASVMSAPAALVMAKIILPEREESVTKGHVKVPPVKIAGDVIEAAAVGAADGVKLAVNVGAMLLAFIALIAVINAGMGIIHQTLANWVNFNYFPQDLRTLFGWIFSPLAWVMGVPWKDCLEFGNLLGTKISINEFVAYVQLGETIKTGAMSERAVIIATYALCGFANFSSIAIQIGGIGGMAPERRSDLAKLGLRAMFGGALASWMTATIAGMLTG